MKKENLFAFGYPSQRYVFVNVYLYNITQYVMNGFSYYFKEMLRSSQRTYGLI